MDQKVHEKNFRLGVATITVSDLKISRAFYEEIIGFTFHSYYEPTEWVAYQMEDNVLFAIQEMKGFQRQNSVDMLDFYVDDIDSFWNRIKDRCAVVLPLERTPWGSYKFVVQDPDGFMLGFVKKEVC